MKSNIDREYWNIVKGIGIILVVVGHCCIGVSRFIYLFHMPLFFFISGYLYNEEKYGDNPYLNIANRIKSSWMKYVIIFWILILLHNLFFENELLGLGAYRYTNTDIVNKMAEATLGMGNELMGATLWFVPVQVMSVSLLGWIVTLSRKFQQITHSNIVKYLFQAATIIACGACGYILEAKQISLVINMQIVLVVIPFLWGGYLLRNTELDLKKYLNVIVALIATIIVYWAHLNYSLDLVFQVVYPLMFFIAFLGIYMCLYVSKCIVHVNVLKKICSWFGEHSFWIMFLHFPLFRFFDWLYIIFKCDSDFVLYRNIPVAFPNLWPIYLIVGLVLPLVVCTVLSTIKRLCVGEK